MINYKFTDFDREWASKVARLRNELKEEHGCKINLPLTKRQIANGYKTILDVHYIGVLAELAVALTFGTSIWISPTFKRGDAGFDMVWKRKFVEVKYSNMNTPELYIRPDKKGLADIYILVIGNEYEMKLIGWATRDDFENEKLFKIKDYGDYGKPVRAISHKLLRPMESLWDWHPKNFNTS